MVRWIFCFLFFSLTSNAFADEDPWYKTAPSCVIDRGNPARRNEYNVEPLTQLHGHVISNEVLGSNSIWALACGDGLWYIGQFTALLADIRKINDPPVWQQAIYDAEYNQSPIFYKGVLYYGVLHFGSGRNSISKLIGLDGKTGKQISELSINKATNYFFIYNDIVYFSFLHEITAYSLKTGKEIWSVSIPPAQYFDNGPGPLATDGSLLYGGGDDLYAIDLKTGKIKWKHKKMKSFPVVYQNKIFTGYQDICSINSKDGSVIKQYASGKYVYILSVTDGLIIASDTNSKGIFVFALNIETKKKLWEFPYQVFTSAVAGKVFYFLDDNHRLHAINKFTGKELWSYQLVDDDPNRTSAPRTLAILPIDKGLLIGDPNGHLQILY